MTHRFYSTKYMFLLVTVINKSCQKTTKLAGKGLSDIYLTRFSGTQNPASRDA